MKIVVNNGDIKTCYVQVRDIKYLADRYSSSVFENIFTKACAEGHNFTDFIPIADDKIASIIIFDSFIIDFSLSVGHESHSLSRMTSLSSCGSSNTERIDFEHKRRDLNDLMNFKRGKLDYQIPILFDGLQKIEFDNATVGSTSMPGYYMLRSKYPDTDLEHILKRDYLIIYRMLGYKGECDGVSINKVGDDLLFRFIVKNKVTRFIDNIKENLKKKLK